jgi:flagellar biosynthetic protein FliP
VTAIERFLDQPHTGSPTDMLIAFFLLSLVPILAMCVTSFTRIIVVLGLVRASFGTAALPPSGVLIALAMMLTGAIMAPTFSTIDREAVQPYQGRRLTASQALERAETPLRSFMRRQVRRNDLVDFARIAHVDQRAAREVPLSVLVPAFLVGELRTAFAMGFALALPFAVIDIIVGVILMSLGMFMVSPATISLPVKLLLFVAVDGWGLISAALAASFR